MFGFSPFSASAFSDLLETNRVDITLTGVVGSVQLGTAGTSADAVIVETGEEAVVSLGNAVAQANANATPAGVAATATAGTLNATGIANVTPNGVEATVSLGNAVAQANASAPVSGIEALGATGTVTTPAGAGVSVTGVSSTCVSGTATATGASSTFVTGVEAQGAVATPTTAGGSNVFVSGVQAVGRVTRPLVWSAINDNQTPNWVQIRDGNRYEGPRGVLFGFGAFSEAPFASLGFEDVPEEQWKQVNDGNTVVWVEIPT
jgi:hypothetical protein